MQLITRQKPDPKSIRKNNLIKELEILEDKIYKQQQLFNMTSCDEEIEALIYEEKSLSIRYSALIKRARENDIKVQYFERWRG